MSEDKYSVIAESISKCYKMYSGPKQKLLDLILPKGAGKNFYALKDISFKVQKGDVVGLIGLNGSGKSTLSNIIGGVSMPTQGKIEIKGEASLIAIGLGLNNFLTGMENIEVKAIMMGYKKDEIEKITQEIIDFADIGDFITQPIRTYSSGMRSRLGFAISVYTNPDILVIDEALSVGDPTFTQKCLNKMNEFKDKGKTIFFVSHSTSQIRQFCNKAVWLEYGALREVGDTVDVLPKYDEYIKFVNSMTEHEKKEYKKNVLKSQEHALLKDFKLIDPKFKKVKPRGKIFKYVSLINKLGNVKSIPYNVDMATIALGFLPSLFRRRFLTALLILVSQIANIFIIPYPVNIISNFLICVLCGMFTGKSYINYLIEKQGYMDYNIWKLNNVDSDLKEAKLKRSRTLLEERINFNRIVAMVSVVLICLIPAGAYAFQYRNELIALATSSKPVEFNANIAIIIAEDGIDGQKNISSIGKLSKGENEESIRLTTYPGNMQVKYNNEYDEIKNVVKLEDDKVLKDVFKENFNEDFTDYIIVDSVSYGIDLKKYTDESILFNDIIIDFLNSDERGINDKKEKLIKSKSSLNKEKIEGFYENFKGINKITSSRINVEEVSLLEIIEENILDALGEIELKEYKFIITDKTKIEETKLVKELRKKHEELINKVEDTEVPQNTNTGINTQPQWKPPNNNGQNKPVTPPSKPTDEEEQKPEGGGNENSTEPPTDGGNENPTEPPAGGDDTKPEEGNISTPIQ